MKKILLFITVFYFSCSVEVSKIQGSLDNNPDDSGDPYTIVKCSNGAWDYPNCKYCPEGQDMDPATNICVENTIIDCLTGIGKTLQWDPYMNSNAKGFRLYSSLDNDSFTLLVDSITPYTTTTYSFFNTNNVLIIDLNPCVANYLHLTAYGDDIESPPSSPVCWGRCP